MKQIFLILILSLLLLQSTFPQIQKPAVFSNAFVSVGYGNTISGTVSDYYNNLVDSYRFSGIPIPTQNEFGPTLYANTGFVLYRLEKLGVGISFGYLNTSAYSSYKDYSGTAKINSSIHNMKFY